MQAEVGVLQADVMENGWNIWTNNTRGMLISDPRAAGNWHISQVYLIVLLDPYSIQFSYRIISTKGSHIISLLSIYKFSRSEQKYHRSCNDEDWLDHRCLMPSAIGVGDDLAFVQWVSGPYAYTCIAIPTKPLPFSLFSFFLYKISWWSHATRHSDKVKKNCYHSTVAVIGGGSLRPRTVPPHGMETACYLFHGMGVGGGHNFLRKSRVLHQFCTECYCQGKY